MCALDVIYCPFQVDLRDDPKTIAKLNDVKEKPIATEQGQKLAKEVRKGNHNGLKQGFSNGFVPGTTILTRK